MNHKYAPHNTYMKNTIRGGDRYHRIRVKRSLFGPYVIFIAIILLAVFGTLLVVASIPVR